MQARMAHTLSCFARKQTDTSSDRLLEIAYTLQVIALKFFQMMLFLAIPLSLGRMHLKILTKACNTCTIAHRSVANASNTVPALWLPA